jgi:hypothetical protein
MSTPTPTRREPVSNARQRTTVSRAKVEQLAAAVREMFDLKGKQAVTQAQLIRWCVRAIQKALEPQPRYEQGSLADRRKLNADRDLALLHLEWLATKLEDQGKPSGDLTPSIKG